MSQQAQPQSLKIFFYAVDGIGHLNACVGLAQALAKRGHRIYFLLNDAFVGQFAKFGFEEILLKQAGKATPQPNEVKQAEPKRNPVREMAEMLVKNGFLSPKSPIEKLKAQMEMDDNGMAKFYHQAVEYNPQIGEAIEREKPDLVIIDSVIIFPSVRQANIPWMLLFSPNPVMLYNSDKLPPFSSGLPIDSDPATWVEIRELWKAYWNKHVGKFQNMLNREFNYEPPEHLKNEDGQFFDLSPYLNIYGFPKELDYDDVVPKPDNIVSMDAFCRDSVEPFEIPDELNVQPGDKLIYVSLGSMGSIDVKLMKRILSVLEKSPHKYIVSKGQRGDEYELPDNCWGQNFLPQTKILPIVDLVITHGGNNTITESFSFGKPMIVMPLFGDQYDNAQRVHEKGYGVRLETYHFTEDELIGAIDKLLKDTKLHQRLKTAAERMNSFNSKAVVCKKIEDSVAKFQFENLI